MTEVKLNVSDEKGWKVSRRYAINTTAFCNIPKILFQWIKYEEIWNIKDLTTESFSKTPCMRCGLWLSPSAISKPIQSWYSLSSYLYRALRSIYAKPHQSSLQPLHRQNLQILSIEGKSRNGFNHFCCALKYARASQHANRNCGRFINIRSSKSLVLLMFPQNRNFATMLIPV